MSLEIFFCKVVCTYKAVPIFITIFYLLVQKLDFKPEVVPRKDVPCEWKVNSHWWCDSQSSKKHTCHKKKVHEGLDFFLLFPDQIDRGDEFMCHNRGVEKCREDKKNCTAISIFFISSKVTFCPELQGFMKVTMSGKISLVEAMMKHRKMMRNKYSEQTLQVNIQYYI